MWILRARCSSTVFLFYFSCSNTIWCVYDCICSVSIELEFTIVAKTKEKKKKAKRIAFVYRTAHTLTLGKCRKRHYTFVCARNETVCLGIPPFCWIINIGVFRTQLRTEKMLMLIIDSHIKIQKNGACFALKFCSKRSTRWKRNSQKMAEAHRQYIKLKI